ncbi:MAG: alpha/beta hydrolase [Actinobacteria bacterium]|nr:MAG: alpha/beta hydrolase [Actinomycetota bacterium]
MLTAIVFTWFASAALLTINALRKPVPPGRRFPPLWLPGMVVSELAPWAMVVHFLLAMLLVWTGGADTGLGATALGLFAFTVIGHAVLMRRSLRSAAEAGDSPSLPALFRIAKTVPEGVSVSEGIPYHADLTMTIIRRESVEKAPALIYLHPGSWMRGSPGRQARPLLHGLADRGWVVLDISYPLSPAATFPDHLIGVKRAIAWAKSEASNLSIDPELVAIAGGSSGAHLSALAALTHGIQWLQPGFEDADTSVFACAPHYGIYDLLVRNETRYDWPFIAKHVMKAKSSESPDLYRLGSPIDLVHESAPPFCVLHGELDSVVLPAESVHFVDALRTVGAEARYHQVVGGQHGFDAFSSLRSRAVAQLVMAFLESEAERVRTRGRLQDR